MSNVISIHGYTIVHHKGEPMIRDLDLALRLEYERPRDIRKLVKRMIERGQLKQDQVCAKIGQTSELGGRPSTEYFLGEAAALMVATRSNTEKAYQITDEIIHVFIDARRGKPEEKAKPRSVDPVLQKTRQADALLSFYLKAGKKLGTDDAMSRAIAVEQVRSTVGLDLKPLLAHNTVEEAPVTPTELGKAHGLSGVKMNAKLEEAGLQKKVGKSWEPTDKAKEHCTINPFKSEHSDHSGYQLKWYPRVLEMFDVLKARESAQ